MTSGLTLNKRVQRITAWCDQRGINQVFAFFRGCDPSLNDQEARVRYVLRNGAHTATDTDEPWIESMERSMIGVWVAQSI